MAIVGSAQVRISANTVGFKPQVRAAMEGIRPIVKDEGARAGASFGSAFSQGMGKSLGDLNNAWKRAGNVANQAFASGFSSGGGVEDELQRVFSRTASMSDRSGNESGSRFFGGFRRSMSSGMQSVSTTLNSMLASVGRESGERAGSSFAASFGASANSGMGKAAKQAANQFTLLYGKGALAGSAIYQLAAAMSSLVGGLYAVGTAAASAASGIAAIAGVAGAALQGGIALSVAFKGVGDAMKQGFQQGGTAATQSGAAAVGAARRVADARQRIADVQVRNAQRMADAEDRVNDAEQDLLGTQRELEAAQRRLNAAREDAIEELQQLNFSVEDAALAEERAALSLERAYAELEAVQGLPVDSMARREAELAFKEAELNYRTAKDRAADLAVEQERAAAAGLEGTRAYSSALNDVISAQNAVADAEDKVADAREDLGRVAADGTRDLADAQQDLARALEDAGRAASGSASSVDRYAEALAKLSPSAQSFVRQMVGLESTFNDFKKAVQEPFFAELNTAFFQLIDVILPVLQTGLSGAAKIMGTLAAQLAGAISSNASGFAAAMEQNNQILSIFTREGSNGKSMMDDLVTAFLNLWTAIGPVTEKFAEWLVLLADRAAVSTTENLGKMTDFFDRAGERAASFGTIFGSIFDLFSTLATASSNAADLMLSYFESSFAGMASTAEDNLGEITAWFDQAARNSQAILDFFGALGLEFLKLGNNDKVADTFKILKDGSEGSQSLIESIRIIGESLADTGPQLATLINNVAETLSLLADSGALSSFFGVLNFLFETLNDFLGNPIVDSMMAAVAPLLGAAKAIGLVILGLSAVGKIFFGYILKALDLFGPAVSGIATAMGKLGTGKLIPTAMKGPLASAGNKLDEYRETKGMTADGKGIVAAINKLCGCLSGGFSTGGDDSDGKKKKSGSSLGVTASNVGVGVDIDKDGKGAKGAGKLGGAIGALGGAFSALMGPLGLVMMLLPLLLPIFMKLWEENENLRTAVMQIAEVFGTVFSTLATAFMPVLTLLADAFGKIVQAVAPVITTLLGALLPVIMTLIDAFVGTLVPVIEMLAPIFSQVFGILVGVIQQLVPIIVPIIMLIVDALAGTLIPVIETLLPIVATVFQTIGQIIAQLLPVVLPIITLLIESIANTLIPVIQMLLPIVATVFQTIGQLIAQLLPVVLPIFGMIVETLAGALIPIIQALLPVVMTVFQTVGNVIAQLVPVILPIFGMIIEALAGALIPIIQSLLPVVMTVFRMFAQVIMALLPVVLPIIMQIVNLLISILIPAIEALMPVIKFVAEFLGNALKLAFQAIDWAWKNILSPVLDFLIKGFEKIPSFIQGVVNTIKTIWDTLVEIVKAPIRTIMNGINDWLIKPLNAVGKAFGFEITPLTVNFAEGGFVGPRRNFAAGGKVTGWGGPTQDNIPANLSAGEYVIPTRRVNQYGLPFFDAIRSGKYPLSRGGGTPWDFVGQVVSGAADWVRDGVLNAASKVVSEIINPVLRPLRGQGLVQDMIVKFFEAMGAKITSWGQSKQKEQDAQATAQGDVPPYSGPPGGWTYPLGTRVRWTTYPGHSNGGIDFPAPMGTAILAASAGAIARKQQLAKSYGWWIELSHAGGVRTRYAHMSKFASGLNAGSVVKTGQIIGFVGSTGNSTGPHLHFEYLPPYGSSAAAALRMRGVKLASGGVVRATPGGVMAMLAEGGKHERVEPLDSQGLSARDRALIAEMASKFGAAGGGAGGPIVVRVYIGDRELTDLVRFEIDDSNSQMARKIAVGRRRG